MADTRYPDSQIQFPIDGHQTESLNREINKIYRLLRANQGVTGFVNDVNVVASVLNGIATLGWSGQLSLTRGGLGFDAHTIGKGGLLSGGGAGFLSIVPVGTNGLVLTADSTQPGGIKWAAAGAGTSGLNLLEQHTVVGAVSIDFTTRNVGSFTGASFQSDFSRYMIDFYDLVPGTNDINLEFVVSTNGGSTWDTGANYGRAVGYFNAGATVQQGAESGLTNVTMATDLVNTTTEPCVGTIDIYDPLSTTQFKNVLWRLQYLNAVDAKHYTNMGRGQYRVSGSGVNAFRLLPSSGNWSGTAKLYGLS